MMTKDIVSGMKGFLSGLLSPLPSPRDGERGRGTRVLGVGGVAWLVCVGMVCLQGGICWGLVIEAEKASLRTEGGRAKDGGWNLWSNGRVGEAVRIAKGGKYSVVVRGYGSVAGGVWPEMGLMVDGRTVERVSVVGVKAADYRFEVELPAGTVEISAAFRNDEVVGTEDRNLFLDRITIIPPAGVAEPVLGDQKDLGEAAEKREKALLAGTAAAIEKNRKSEARVRVVDAAGKGMAGREVLIEQIGHEFLFGCNIFEFDRFGKAEQNEAYKKRFEELFNYATVGLYWRWYEREKGRVDYSATDRVVDWCVKRGIRVKGHPLLWGNEAGVPMWSKGQPGEAIQRERVETIMRRYKGRIGYWEVVNEPSHERDVKIDGPYRWAREADGAGHLIVNDYHALADGCPEFFKLLGEAKRSGVPFDGIGIQAHEPRMMWFPLDEVQAILDQYAGLGKALHITEFTPPSGGQAIIGGYREGVWDEAAQAEYAEKFYRVCFAHPAMRGITWWDLCDTGAWLKGGGMLRADLTAKPVYERLKRLIHEEWTTRVQGKTDGMGRISFRGFRGTYRVVVDTVKGKVERRMEVGGEGEVVLSAE